MMKKSTLFDFFVGFSCNEIWRLKECRRYNIACGNEIRIPIPFTVWFRNSVFLSAWPITKDWRESKFQRSNLLGKGEIVKHDSKHCFSMDVFVFHFRSSLFQRLLKAANSSSWSLRWQQAQSDLPSACQLHRSTTRSQNVMDGKFLALKRK